jgi:hypothetical protein
MLNRMRAEICFCNRDDMNAAASELIELDFEVRELDWIDDESSAVWIVADTLTALDPTIFLDRVSTVVDPFDGFVVEAGPSSWPMRARRACNRVWPAAGNHHREDATCFNERPPRSSLSTRTTRVP